MKQKHFYSCLLLFLVSITMNAYDLEMNGIYYNITSANTVEVTYVEDGDEGNADFYYGDITIPRRISKDGTTYSVTAIGDYAFNNCSDLTSVTIPNSVTSIGDQAFLSCYRLTSVTIPNSVTSIGDLAFYDCSGLTSVVIPESVTSIGNSAFSWCSGLTSVTIPESVTSIGDGAFAGCLGLNAIIVDDGNWKYDSRDNCNAIIETENNTLISGCKSTVIPNSVTSIGDQAFYYCSGLTSVNIPNSVTSIGNYAFSCTGLTSVTIPESVTSIGDRAFANCSGLTSVVIPESVTSIGNSAFSWCSGLNAIIVDDGNWKYDSRDNCNAIIETENNTLISGCKSTVIPNSVTSIGNSAFSWCSGLTSVTIPESVTSIGDGAFANCSGLTEIHWTPNADTDLSSSMANAKLTSTSRTLYLNKTADNAAMVDHLVSSLAGKFKEIIVNIDDLMWAYNAAMASIKEDNYYQIYTLVDGIPYYLTNTGTLTANEEEAYSFKMTTARRSGTKYETGWNTSVPFTTPTLTNGYTGDIVNDGSIHRNSNNRDDFERQVFFEVAGKYAVRATNSGSTNWGANTYWAQVGTTELPEAGYSLDPSFIWMLNDVTGPAILAEARAIVEAKESVGPNLFQKSEEDYESFSVAVDDAAAVIESTTASSEEKDAAITALRTALDAYNNVNNLPDPSKAYTFKQKASGLYMGLSADGVMLASKENGSELFFEAGENGGYFIHDAEGQYVGFEGSNNWTMSTSADKKYEWVVTLVGDNYYTLSKPSNANHHVGTNDNDIAEGAPCYADKNNSDNSYYLWKIAQVNINFADDNVKALCVANWDTNHDGELSYNEAAAVTSLGEVFKGNTEITSIDELQYFTGLTAIGKYAFFGCSSLTSVTIPENVTSIGEWAFSGCTGLTSVTIPESVTSIGDEAFSYCYGLTSVTIPNSVKSIGSSAFKGCSGLTSVTIPESVTSIGDYAFEDCSGLTSVTIPESVTSIGDGAFAHCSGLNAIIVDDGNTKYDSRDNCNAIIETETNTLISGCKSTVIPNSVTSIGYEAFTNCYGLTSVIIPESVTSIGDEAFNFCRGLTSVTIPESVTSIGDRAFYYCSGLTSVNIPESVTSIGYWAFNECDGLTSLTIPESVTSIGYAAFANCSGLTEIHWTPNADINLSSSLSSTNLTSTDRTLYLYKNAGNATMVDQLVTSLDGQFKEIIVVKTDYELSVEDSKVRRGAELVLPVLMYNKETITAFQFEVSLPEGISLTKCELTDRKGSDHTVSFTKKANGNYQVVAISMTSAPFSGNEGELLNLTLEVDENMKADDYTIGITNIELTTKQAEAIELLDLNASLTVLDVMLGDINADGRVTITDAVGIVNYILDNPPSKFIYEAADMNQDNKVSITDAVAIVNFILSEEQSANVRRAMDAINQRFADTLDPQ